MKNLRQSPIMKRFARYRRRNRLRRSRMGAVLSMELILVLPIVIGLMFATIEIGMIWASGARVKEAAAAGCRMATFRGADEAAIRRAVEIGLGRKNLMSNYSLQVSPSQENPQEVCVSVSVPMKVAAPDLLKFLGFSLGDRKLVAQCIMRRE